ncbi:MAG: hypothetical protein AB3N23_22740 [Paracoccaceae bacterium]
MRPVLHGDVSAAARVLLRVPHAAREALCRQMLDEAQLADDYAQKHGRTHPRYGNGSLMGAARKRALAPEPSFDNRDYCRCMALVLLIVATRLSAPIDPKRPTVPDLIRDLLPHS